MHHNSRELCRRFLRGHCEFGDQCRFWHGAAGLDYGGAVDRSTPGRGRRGGRHSYYAEQHARTSRQGGWQLSEAVYRHQEWGSVPGPAWGVQQGWGWQMAASPPPQQTYGGRGGRPYDNTRGGHGRGGRGIFPSSPGRGWGRSSHQRTTPASFNGTRKWSFNEDGGGDGERMLVMSYNLLSSGNAKQHRMALYAHIPWQDLDWRTRWAILQQEIQHWSADIIALQEVDQYHDVKRDLSKLGYQGIFSKRSGEYMDGCAVFWRTSRFQLVEMESIDFGAMDMRNNAAQLVVLEGLPDPGERVEQVNAAVSNSVSGSGSSNECKDEACNNMADEDTQGNATEGGAGLCPGRKIVVSNIHVLFNPKRGDIKLGQLRVLTERVHQMSQKHGGIPALMCGDFNIIPNSALYNFIARARLDCRTVDRRNMSGQLDCSRPIVATPRYRRVRKSLTATIVQEAAIPIPSADVASGGQDGAQSKVTDIDEGPEKENAEEGATVMIAAETERLEQLKVLTPVKARREAAGNVEDENVEEVVEVLTVKRMRFDGAVEGEGVVMEAVEARREEEADGKGGGDEAEEMAKEEVEGEEAEEMAKEEVVGMEVRIEGGDGEVGVIDVGSEKVELEKKREWGLEEDSGSEEELREGRSELGPGAVYWDPEELCRASGKDGVSVVSHTLSLKSAYAAVKGVDRTAEGEPLVTSFHSSFMGTVDYIWHTPELHPVRVLEPLPLDTMETWEGLPQGCWASDHFSLVAEFKLVS